MSRKSLPIKCLPINRRLTLDNCQLFSPGIGGEISLVVDVTGSMDIIIDSLREFLVKYMKTTYGNSITKMGLVCMDDHYRRGRRRDFPGYLFADATNTWEVYQSWLEDMPEGDGGDYPEEWVCSVARARELTPNGAIWLLSDAPPHGVWPEGDSFPEGCPYGSLESLKDINVLFFAHSGTTLLFRKLVDKTEVQLWISDIRTLTSYLSEENK